MEAIRKTYIVEMQKLNKTLQELAVLEDKSGEGLTKEERERIKTLWVDRVLIGNELDKLWIQVKQLEEEKFEKQKKQMKKKKAQS